MTDGDMALIARALAHPARIRIVRLLATQTECRGAEVFSDLPLAQSTVSEHLRILKDAGLVRSKPVGSANVYCLVSSVLDEFSRALLGLAAEGTACAPDRRGC